MSGLHLARERLHAASQWLARLAYAYATPSDDDSHSALRWESSALHTQPLGTVGAARLDATTLALTLGDRSVPLAGLDERQRYDAVIALLALVGLEGKQLSVALPWTGEAPDADVTAERQVTPEHAEALAALYEGASSALMALASSTPQASPVRLWPHHFDIASLVTQASPFDSVGVGMAPDDEHFSSPYWYVAPWPVPVGALPPAPAGWDWHRDGFTALTRRASQGDLLDDSALAQAMGVAKQASPPPAA
ncbi:MAG: hypothetical protein AAFX85_05195 [Pseudomonadota bacterium]